MASRNKEETPSEDKSCGETKEEVDEDDMEFSFDLPEEWMVVDEDDEDDDEIKNNASVSKESHPYLEKDNASKSEGKESQISQKTKSSDDKSKKDPKKSTGNPKDAKKEVTHPGPSSSKQSSSVGNLASIISASETLSNPVATQEKGNSKKGSKVPSKALSNPSSSNVKDPLVKKLPEDKTKTKAAQTPGKSVSAVDSPKMTTRAASKDNTKGINEKTARPQTPKQTATDRSIKTNDKIAETSVCSTELPSSKKTPKVPDESSKGKTNNSNVSSSKSSYSESSTSLSKTPASQKTPKVPEKISAGKTNNTTKQTSHLQSPTSASSQKTLKLPEGNSTTKTNDSNISASKSSELESSASLNKVPSSKKTPKLPDKTSGKTQNTVNQTSKMSQPQSSSKPPSSQKTLKSPDKTSSAKTSNNTNQTPSAASQTTQAQKATLNKASSKTPKSVEKLQGGTSQSQVSDKRMENLSSKPAQRPMKPVRNPEATGEIAEAMEAGDLELCDILVHDLDSEDPGVKNKMVQNKPVHSSGLSPKKRPLQNDGDNVVKKAKYEEKDTDVHFRDSKEFSSKQKDGIKGSSSGEKELSINKQITKRIVRRFHRTTQTFPKTTASQLVQCSLGQPPPGSSSKKQQNNSGIQCNIGEKFEDVRNRISSHLTPAVNSINQEVFKAVLAFDASSIHQDMVTPGTYKYGIRFGQVSQSDVEKNFFKDNCLKKADSFSISFWKKDCGIVDLLFYEEENFISVLNQIRKSRLESRYICVSMLKKTEEEKGCEKLWDYLKATIVFDQNFVSTGYLSYYKTPIWSKPKVDEFVTMHDVPSGIPLSFLNLVIPDAITVLMRDVKAKFTRKGSGVRLGMNRKNGSTVFLKLFKQVLLNNFPVSLTQGLTERKNIPSVQGESKVTTELEKLEREIQRGNLSLRSITATPRDINNSKQRAKTEGKGSSHGNKSSHADNLGRKGTLKGSQETKQDVDSDLSDISELSFSAHNFNSSMDDVKSNRANREPPQKKIEPKKSLNVSIGSKLLSRARTNLKSKRQERASGKKPVNARGTRRSPDRHSNRIREDFSRRLSTVSNRSNDMRRNESRQRGEPHNRQRDSLQKERIRSNMSRENLSIDRLSEGSGSRHGQRSHRDLDHNRARHDKSPVRPFRGPTSNNRSPEREVLVRSSNRMPRSQERYDGGERGRLREGDGNYMDFGLHSSSMGDSRDRRVSLENASEMLSDLKSSSEDLRALLDARKPSRHVRMSPRRHESKEPFRFGSPGRQPRSKSRERRKRPLSRSPSPRYRKVLIGRRSLSPRNRARRERRGESPQPSRPGMDFLTRDTVRGKASDSRNVQAPIQPHGSGDQATKEESMRISKSLFVKLLTNALHGEGGDIADENISQTAKRSFSPHRIETGRVVSQRRSQETRDKEDRSYGNIDSFKSYSNIEPRRPDYEKDQSRYGPSGSSRGNFEQGSLPGGDVRPIPPPVLPPILTSSSSFPVNKFDPLRPREEGPSSTGSQIPQGIWAAPSSSSFTFPLTAPTNMGPPSAPERHPFPPPNREPMPVPPPQNHPPFNTQPSMMFMNTRPPFQPPQGPMPNVPPGMRPPRPGMWQNPPRPGPF